MAKRLTLKWVFKKLRREGLGWSNSAQRNCVRGHAVAQLVEALRFKQEGRGFDFC
jgi:hypothetical protein